eukprot:TRINITY_DN9188_c0_g1_i2.p1 TRINITY_DN9188_c0_g1~~TRINITY_DN9188_c0_g1_i2.p1  ORF type:complete len:122 (-),score=37.74 TRINITY_DN9188_c0_g1_i2:130-495(-)
MLQQQQMMYEYYRQAHAAMWYNQQAAAAGQAPLYPQQPGAAQAAAPGAPPAGDAAASGAAPSGGAVHPAALAGFSKPKALPIINPNSGNAIDVLGLNFEPRKPSNPLKIVDPGSGAEVKIK